MTVSNNKQGQSQEYPRLMPVDGFAIVNFTAGCGFKKYSLFLKLANLFNKYNYYVHENYSINPIAPRQVIGPFSYKF